MLPAVALLLALAPTPLQEAKPRLDALCDRLPGRMGYALIELRTGETISHRGDERFPAASTIKTAIALEALRQVDAGKLRMTDRRAVPPQADRKPWEASKWSYFLRDGVEPDLDGWLSLMIGVSDNLATRVVREWVGVPQVNATLSALGLEKTRALSGAPATDLALQRQNAQFGMGVTTPNEMARLLALIYRGRAASPAACERLVRMMSHQYWDDWIGIAVPLGVKVASKSGAIERSRSDTAIVYAKNPYVLAIYTDNQKDRSWESDNAGHRAIVRLAREVYQALNGGDARPAPGYEERFLPTGGGI